MPRRFGQRIPQMNESADFVMYWWDHAAELLTRKDTAEALRLRHDQFDHPGILAPRHGAPFQGQEADLAGHGDPRPSLDQGDQDAAAVRIAMTVAARGVEGVLAKL